LKKFGITTKHYLKQDFLAINLTTSRQIVIC
jgi:hypothetical protein